MNKSPLILVGAHHKAGTNLLFGIFNEICKRRNEYFFYGNQSDAPKLCSVLFHDNSDFDLVALSTEFRGLHIIRDPRDIIISGAFYHRHSDEAWLHEPQPQFGSMTYQQAINSCSTDEEAILFEMENAAMYTIKKMLDWDYANPCFFETRYEDLVQDHSLEIFKQIFVFLGYPDDDLPELLNIAYKNSLFSGVKSPHIRSGKPYQWKQYFTPALKFRFLELYGDALQVLGYEKIESSW